MSLGPVGNNSQLQQTNRAAELASKKEPAKAAEPATENAVDAAAKTPATQEVQDAARQLQDAAGKAIQQKLEPLPTEWQEAKGRKRGGRGGITVGQGPTRGLTNDVA